MVSIVLKIPKAEFYSILNNDSKITRTGKKFINIKIGDTLTLYYTDSRYTKLKYKVVNKIRNENLTTLVLQK